MHAKLNQYIYTVNDQGGGASVNARAIMEEDTYRGA
jgi:hypothetical protein